MWDQKEICLIFQFERSRIRRLEFQNKVKIAEYELLQFRENQSQQIKASSDGTITNIFYRRGQRVQPLRPLLQIFPSQLNLIVRLYIPYREIGFLKKNQKINLKYDAYPSQRFGFYEAIIKEISQTILTDEKEDKPIHIGEPYYKIKAELIKPYIIA